jgi:hypothetical protein
MKTRVLKISDGSSIISGNAKVLLRRINHQALRDQGIVDTHIASNPKNGFVCSGPDLGQKHERTALRILLYRELEILQLQGYGLRPSVA